MSIGPNLISVFLVKAYAELFAPKLEVMFCSSVTSGLFPNSCKKKIVPMHKSGTKTEVYKIVVRTCVFFFPTLNVTSLSTWLRVRLFNYYKYSLFYLACWTHCLQPISVATNVVYVGLSKDSMLLTPIFSWWSYQAWAWGCLLRRVLSRWTAR